MHTIEHNAPSNSLPQVAWGALVLICGSTWLGVRIGLWRVFVGTAGIIAGLSLILTPKRTRGRAGGSELDLNRVRRLPATHAGRVRVTRRSA